MKTTISAGSAESMNAARHRHGASRFPTIGEEARERRSTLQVGAVKPRTCGGTVSPTSACATAHSPPTPTR